MLQFFEQNISVCGYEGFKFYTDRKRSTSMLNVVLLRYNLSSMLIFGMFERDCSVFMIILTPVI